jgi:Erg28 like protein
MWHATLLVVTSRKSHSNLQTMLSHIQNLLVFTNFDKLISVISDLVPSHRGYLPKWQLFVAITALANTIQCFLGVSATRKVYNLQSGLGAGSSRYGSPELLMVNPSYSTFLENIRYLDIDFIYCEILCGIPYQRENVSYSILTR